MPLLLLGCAAVLLASVADALPGPLAGTRYAQVTIKPTKTSIYIGNVSLTLPPLKRHGDFYTASYTAKVFPFFFYSEHGSFTISFTETDLQQLHQGATVFFKGQANNSEGQSRRIEGRAMPDGTGLDQGKIKVRVWVGKIQLIFNTTYRFSG